MGEPQVKRLMTAEEVAEKLNVDIQRVWKMSRDGVLPKVPGLGKRIVRFNPDVVDRLFFTEVKTKK